MLLSSTYYVIQSHTTSFLLLVFPRPSPPSSARRIAANSKGVNWPKETQRRHGAQRSTTAERVHTRNPILLSSMHASHSTLTQLEPPVLTAYLAAHTPHLPVHTPKSTYAGLTFRNTRLASITDDEGGVEVYSRLMQGHSESS